MHYSTMRPIFLWMKKIYARPLTKPLTPIRSATVECSVGFSTCSMTPETRQLAEGVLRGNRLALSRAITLIESTKESHRLDAEALLDHVVYERSRRVREKGRLKPGNSTSNAACVADEGRIGTSENVRPLRVGIAGPPGAGKSTFIEALGKYLTDSKKLRVAVIAVDPSSSRSGGSILGDKTRMYELAKDPKAFVRACPTSGVLGGVARYTNDVVLLCQAASFDIVFIESVGLGQSETIIDQASDMLLLLVPPAGGDELQGVKKGIMEVADVIVVNKADGHLLTAAQHTAAAYQHALCFQRRKWDAWMPSVTLCSALERHRIADVWEQVCSCSDVFRRSGYLRLKRQNQDKYWVWNSLEDILVRRARTSSKIKAGVERMEKELGKGTLTPRSAAEILLADFFEEQKSPTKSMAPFQQSTSCFRPSSSD